PNGLQDRLTDDKIDNRNWPLAQVIHGLLIWSSGRTRCQKHAYRVGAAAWSARDKDRLSMLGPVPVNRCDLTRSQMRQKTVVDGQNRRTKRTHLANEKPSQNGFEPYVLRSFGAGIEPRT